MWQRALHLQETGGKFLWCQMEIDHNQNKFIYISMYIMFSCAKQIKCKKNVIKNVQYVFTLNVLSRSSKSFWQFWTHVAQFLWNFQILAFMLYWKAEASYCHEKLHKSLVSIVDGKCSGKSFVSLQTGPRLCRAKGVSNTMRSGGKIVHKVLS